MTLTKALDALADRFDAHALEQAEDEVRRLTIAPDPPVTLRDAERLVRMVQSLYDVRSNMTADKVRVFILSRILG